MHRLNATLTWALLTGKIVCRRVNLSESVINRGHISKGKICIFKELLKACFRSIVTFFVYLHYILKSHYGKAKTFHNLKKQNWRVNLSELVINAGHISPHNQKEKMLIFYCILYILKNVKKKKKKLKMPIKGCFGNTVFFCSHYYPNSHYGQKSVKVTKTKYINCKLFVVFRLRFFF